MMLTNTKFFKTLLLLLLLQMPFAYAEQKPVAQLKNFLINTRTLTANFKQVVYDEAGKEKQTSHGIFNLSRPGKFRWNYQKPFLQEIVSNNGKVWFYDADLEQVTIKKLDKSMGSTPALLLTGDVDIEKEFTIEKQGDEEGMQWIKLLPKNPESNFKYVLIGLNEGVLGGMELSDNFGQLTRIYFSEVVLNPQIRAEEFTFTPPKGVDILEDKAQETEQVKPHVKKPEPEQVKEPEPDEQQKQQDKSPVEEQIEEQLDDQSEYRDQSRPHVRSHSKNVDKTADKNQDKDKKQTKTKDKHSDKDKSNDKHKDKDKSKDKADSKSKSKDKSETKTKTKDKKDQTDSKSKSKSKSDSKSKSKDKADTKAKSKSKDKHK